MISKIKILKIKYASLVKSNLISLIIVTINLVLRLHLI